VRDYYELRAFGLAQSGFQAGMMKRSPNSYAMYGRCSLLCQRVNGHVTVHMTQIRSSLFSWHYIGRCVCPPQHGVDLLSFFNHRTSPVAPARVPQAADLAPLTAPLPPEATKNKLIIIQLPGIFTERGA
jgi:hypothetical protein